MKKITVILAFVMTFVSNCFGQLVEDFNNGSNISIITSNNVMIGTSSGISALEVILTSNKNILEFNINFHKSFISDSIKINFVDTDTTTLDIKINNNNYNYYNNIVIISDSILNIIIDSNINSDNYVKIDNIIVYTTVDTTSSLSKSKEIISLVYPNPTKDLVTIKMDSYDTYTVKLIDPLGRIIQTSEFRGMEGVVDISSQIDGFYLLQITDSKGQVSNKKVQLQK